MKIKLRLHNETKSYDLDNFDLTNEAKQAIKGVIEHIINFKSKENINNFIETLQVFIKFYKNCNYTYYSCTALSDFKTEDEYFKELYIYISYNIIKKFNRTRLTYHKDMLKSNNLKFDNEFDFKLLRVVILNYILKTLKE